MPGSFHNIRRFVCLQPMSASTHARCLAAGQRRVVVARVLCVRLFDHRNSSSSRPRGHACCPLACSTSAGKRASQYCVCRHLQCAVVLAAPYLSSQSQAAALSLAEGPFNVIMQRIALLALRSVAR